jgi:hypothetical protein
MKMAIFILSMMLICTAAFADYQFTKTGNVTWINDTKTGETSSCVDLGNGMMNCS